MSDKNKSEIKFLVELDENRVPEKLFWTAKDGGVEAKKPKQLCCLFGIVKPKKVCVSICGPKICR